MSDVPLRDRLRSVRASVAQLPLFDPDAAPADPIGLFCQWLVSALDAGVEQPNVMTLSTAAADGAPSARTLLLKNVDPDGFWFASLSSGPKGHDLAENPRAALTLYWREQGRQVRVEGSVRIGPRDASEQDFLARHPVARVQAVAGEQSRPLPDPGTVDGLLASARELIQMNPKFVPVTWNAYVLEPAMVEFWQAAPGHEQLRLRYRRNGRNWVRERLWP
jgi:pyridoxamine 5'-phosphate oxidase